LIKSKQVLEVLEMLPLANRNGLDDCKMYEIVHRFVGHDNDQISLLSEKLLESWSHLKNVYRIPKRAHQADTTHRPPSPLSTYSNDEQAMDQKLQPEQHESTDPPASSIQISTPVSIAASPLPSPSTSSSSSSSYASSNGRKRRYESTREFFDPDPDYFEYISMQTPTQSELERVMKYPPQPSIPTAPRAMIDHHPKHSLHYTQKYHQNKYLKNDMTQAEPVYYDYYYYSLPPNWGATTTLDGSLYYYNVETGSTQWEPPCDDTSYESMMPTPVTSTTSSVDEDACLSDIELKMEVGKVVTKYLSTVKSLNDKVAFKQLARKVKGERLYLSIANPSSFS
jgi:hypothetical protein